MPVITTTQSSANYSIRPLVRFDFEYVKTFHGLFKCVLLVLGLINIIIISVASWYGANGFFSTVCSVSFFYTLILLFLFLMHVPEKFYTFPWLPFEIGATCIICLLYFISSLIVILINTATHTAAGIFGLLTLTVYAYSGYLKFKAWKNGELAQGSLTSSTNTTVTTHASAFPA